MKQRKLKNGPLDEIVFELLWNIPIDQTGFPTDSEFTFAQGIFSKLIGDKGYSTHKSVGSTPGVRIYPKIVHQFWKGELLWPVVQIGEGILAVNDINSSYQWEGNYKEKVEEALKVLKESFISPLKFNKASLKYVNSNELPDDNYELFIKKNFQLVIQNKFEVEGSFLGLNLGESYRLNDGTTLSFNLQTVVNSLTQKAGVVWTISAEKVGEIKHEEIDDWLTTSHEQISNLFVNILTPEYYASFE